MENEKEVKTRGNRHAPLWLFGIFLSAPVVAVMDYYGIDIAWQTAVIVVMGLPFIFLYSRARSVKK